MAQTSIELAQKFVLAWRELDMQETRSSCVSLTQHAPKPARQHVAPHDKACYEVGLPRVVLVRICSRPLGDSMHMRKRCLYSIARDPSQVHAWSEKQLQLLSHCSAVLCRRRGARAYTSRRSVEHVDTNNKNTRSQRVSFTIEMPARLERCVPVRCGAEGCIGALAGHAAVRAWRMVFLVPHCIHEQPGSSRHLSVQLGPCAAGG